MPLEIWIAIIAGLAVVIFSSISAGKKGNDDDEAKG